MSAMEDGPTAGSVPDMDKMLAEFYELRGFDASGIPKSETLKKIGLDDLAQMLHA
jgi:aldehyde:ferredoxin oxidoreductase